MDEMFEYVDPRHYERTQTVRMAIGLFVATVSMYSATWMPETRTLSNELLRLAVVLFSVPGFVILVLAETQRFSSSSEFYGLAAKVSVWLVGGLLSVGTFVAMIRLAARA